MKRDGLLKVLYFLLALTAAGSLCSGLIESGIWRLVFR